MIIQGRHAEQVYFRGVGTNGTCCGDRSKWCIYDRWNEHTIYPHLNIQINPKYRDFLASTAFHSRNNSATSKIQHRDREKLQHETQRFVN